MAVDTRNKRASVLGDVLPAPNSGVNAGDRAQVLGLYRGVTVAAGIYTHTAAARSGTFTAAARSGTFTAAARSGTFTAAATNRKN